MHEKLENNITLTFLFIVPEQKNTNHIVPCFQEHAYIDKNEFTFIMVRTTKNLEFKNPNYTSTNMYRLFVEHSDSTVVHA